MISEMKQLAIMKEKKITGEEKRSFQETLWKVGKEESNKNIVESWWGTDNFTNRRVLVVTKRRRHETRETLSISWFGSLSSLKEPNESKINN